MNVLVVAPHPDDEAIGCGGTIALHVTRRDRVVVVFLTSGELGLKHLPTNDAQRIREREAELAAEILKITSVEFLRQPDWFLGDHISETSDALRSIIDREQPGILYVPHQLEWHPDHRVSIQIVSRAFDKSLQCELRGYEVWTPLSEHDYIEDISSTMTSKLKAVRAYESQLSGFQYDHAIRGLNRYRGVLAGKCRYAEVFKSVSVEVVHFASSRESYNASTRT